MLKKMFKQGKLIILLKIIHNMQILSHDFDGQSFNLSLEAYSKPCQTSKMERFAKKINNQKPLPNFVKRPIF